MECLLWYLTPGFLLNWIQWWLSKLLGSVTHLKDYWSIQPRIVVIRGISIIRYTTWNGSRGGMGVCTLEFQYRRGTIIITTTTIIIIIIIIIK